MPFGLHPAYLIILLAIVLIIFGPGKLPELGGAVGRGMREFRRAQDGITRAAEEEMNKPVAEATAADEKAVDAKAVDANGKATDARVESKPAGA